jgi:hypothetical protein
LRLGDFEIPYGEAWLLEAAVRARIPLTFLAMNDKSIRWQFAHRGHEMGRSELLRTLCSLFERGDLVAYHEMLGSHIPTTEQVERALAPPIRLSNGGVAWGTGENGPLSYGLSKAGAARWEQMAEPDWQRYFDDSYPEETSCEMVAGSQSRLDELLARAPEMWSIEPIDGQIELDVLTPYHATYWKTLPTGYRACFFHQSVQRVGPTTTLEQQRRVSETRRWYRSIWYSPEFFTP